MADQKLTSYVKSCVDSGWPPSKIRSDLYQAGWSRKDIEEAIAYASNAPGQAAGLPQKVAGAGQSKKKFYTILVLILIAVGAGTYYFVNAYILSNLPPPALCGDGSCNGQETYEICPADCSPQPLCGDGSCNGQETYEICPADCPAPQDNQDVSLGLNPASKTVSAGETAAFSVEISPVSSLYGFQFDLEFDPGLLQFSQASEGTFLNRNDADSTFCIEPKVSSSGASVTVACTRVGAIGGVDGSGALESFTFTAKGSGAAEPKITKILLVDASIQKINATAQVA